MAQTGNMAGLAARYAGAFLALAQDGGDEETLATALTRLQAWCAKDEPFGAFLRMPGIARAEQERATQAVMAEAGAPQLLKNFLRVLVRNRRLAVLPQILESYFEQRARARGELAVRVESARNLTKAQEAELVATIARVSGKTPQLECHVDESLLGGIVVQMGSRLLDLSVRAQLARFGAQMRGA